MTAPAPSTTPAGDNAPATGEDALGDPGKAALAAERAAKRQAENDLKALRAELDELRARDLSDSEKLNKRASEAETRATAAELRLAKIDAAVAAKLPLAWAERLT